MNNCIYLIDYNCIVDNNSQPIGHTFGLAKNLINLIVRLGWDVVYVCSPEYAKQYSDTNATLPILQSVIKGELSIKQEKEVVKQNFKTINEKIQGGILFFTHIDPTVVRYMPKQNVYRKNVCICFSNIRKVKQTDGLIKSVLRKAYFVYHNSLLKKRVQVVIKTNEKLHFSNKNVLYMPDYYYMPNEYNAYACEKQVNKVVCLGQNNRYKKIIALIHKFKESKYQLVIRGKFIDEKLYEEAKCLSAGCDNIIVENDNLTKEEYYTELASARYCILPYDADFYFERTTGVAIEAMFLDSIIIGPKAILDFNNLKGIAYDSIEELDLRLLDKPHQDILQDYEGKRQNEYSEIFTENVIKNAIETAQLQCRYK